MNRRRFLNSLVGGVAVAAAVRTWPFRVFSFPTQVKAATFTIPADWQHYYPGQVLSVDREIAIVTRIYDGVITIRRGV